MAYILVIVSLGHSKKLHYYRDKMPIPPKKITATIEQDRRHPFKAAG